MLSCIVGGILVLVAETAEALRELGAALRAWRDRLRPEDVELAGSARRRVPGLRRRELAQLAGVSVDYLTQIEQGRAGTPSVHVLNALSRALRLSDDERSYLYAMANHLDPATTAVEEPVPGSVSRLLDRLVDTPAAVCSPSWELLAWNETWAQVHGYPLPGALSPTRNVAIAHFSGAPTRVLRTHQQTAEFAAAVAADLRATLARRPADAEVKDLVRRLAQRSEDFRRHWKSRAVGAYRGENKLVESPAGSDLRMRCDVFTIRPVDNRIVIYSETGRQDPTASVFPVDGEWRLVR
jgi:transcriptional regulator with XRE-family HTH domain